VHGALLIAAFLRIFQSLLELKSVSSVVSDNNTGQACFIGDDDTGKARLTSDNGESLVLLIPMRQRDI
jgi:hypothetical protein